MLTKRIVTPFVHHHGGGVMFNKNLAHFWGGVRKISHQLQQSPPPPPPSILDGPYRPPPLPTLRLVPNQQIIDFQNFLPNIIHQLTTLPEFEGSPKANHRIRDIMIHILPHGKLIRPQMMMAANNHLSKNSKKQNTPADLYTLGWFHEMIQGAACIIDDVLDRAETRRNLPCWHQINELGTAAAHDALLMGSLAFRLFDKNFQNDPMYLDVIKMTRSVIVIGISGQFFDFLHQGGRGYEKLNVDRYTTFMRMKNGYYTFYWAFAQAMLLNGVNDPKLLSLVEQVTADIGAFYSIQDDYIDCLVDPKLTGKNGTDIPDGKPSWPFIVALDKGNENQRRELLENYGKEDPNNIARVKELYVDIGVPKIFKTWEAEASQKLRNDIEALPSILPQEALQSVVNVLIGRSR